VARHTCSFRLRVHNQTVMNFNSPLFDRIRLRRTAEDVKPGAPRCDHPGCAGRGLHRAPKGRGYEGQYWRFCLDHVRQYNHSYNYFAGMSDDAVASYQKEALIGHRPTWAMGVNSAARRRDGAVGGFDPVDDPLGLFGDRVGGHARPGRDEIKPRLSPAALKALDKLGLDEGVDKATVKARYKLLVKRFHPDANGGDRAFEARLQEIIRAYHTLKSIGIG
jgi:hypothetical protein